MLEIPAISYYAGNVGAAYLQGVTLKLKDPGQITLDGPRYTDSEVPYYIAKGPRSERHLGIPSVTIAGTEYKKVLLINPDFSIEGLA
jgi:hypothetical protein